MPYPACGWQGCKRRKTSSLANAIGSWGQALPDSHISVVPSGCHPGQASVSEREPGAMAGPAPWPQPLTDATDRSEEHTSELQSLMRISYAVFCLKKKKKNRKNENMIV